MHFFLGINGAGNVCGVYFLLQQYNVSSTKKVLAQIWIRCCIQQIPFVEGVWLPQIFHQLYSLKHVSNFQTGKVQLIIYQSWLYKFTSAGSLYCRYELLYHDV